MKTALLDRYERNVDGEIIIDVTAARAEDLYNDFDKRSPYIRRDLDSELVAYLIDSVSEIRPEPFVLRFSLEAPPDENYRERIRASIRDYFLYLVEKQQRGIRRMFRRAALLLGIGVTILFLAVWLNQTLGQERSVVANVFAEGLTIAAWVSLWEALAVVLLEWFPHRGKIRLYHRVSNASVFFSPAAEASPPQAAVVNHPSTGLP